jgi:hypothetical protein
MHLPGARRSGLSLDFSSRTRSANPSVSSSRRTVADGERIVRAPPESARPTCSFRDHPQSRDIYEAQLGQVQHHEPTPLVDCLVQESPNSSAVTLSTSPRTASMASNLSKLTAIRKSEGEPSPVVTIATHPAAT